MCGLVSKYAEFLIEVIGLFPLHSDDAQGEAAYHCGWRCWWKNSHHRGKEGIAPASVQQLDACLQSADISPVILSELICCKELF